MVSKLIATCLCHGLLGYASMYHASVLNPMEVAILGFLEQSLERYVNKPSETMVTWVWAFLNTTVIVAWILGSLIIRPVVEQWGRRFCCFILQPLFLIVGSLLMFGSKYANSLEMLVFGHFLAGLAISLTGFVLVCLGEASPVEYKGLTTSIMFLGSPIWMTLGVLLGLPRVLGNDENWQFTLLIPAFPTTIYMVVCLLFVPDSPKYLYIELQHKEKARKAAQFYHGNDVDFEQLVTSMDNEVKLYSEQNPESSTLSEIVKERNLRWPMAVCMVAGFANTAGGCAFIVRPYSTEIMRKTMGIEAKEAAWFSAFYVLLPTALMSMAGLILAWKLPRRLHLLMTMVVADFGLFIVFICQFSHEHKVDITYIGLTGFVLLMTGYAAGAASITMSLPAEICPQKAVVSGTTLGMLASGILGTVQSQCFPPLSQAIKSYATLLFLLPDIFSFIFLFIYMPETRGKTVDQVIEEWMGSNEKSLLIEK